MGQVWATYNVASAAGEVHFARVVVWESQLLSSGCWWSALCCRGSCHSWKVSDTLCCWLWSASYSRHCSEQLLQPSCCCRRQVLSSSLCLLSFISLRSVILQARHCLSHSHRHTEGLISLLYPLSDVSFMFEGNFVHNYVAHCVSIK